MRFVQLILNGFSLNLEVIRLFIHSTINSNKKKILVSLSLAFA